MEIVKKELEVTVYGNKYSLKLPSAFKMAEFEESMKGLTSAVEQINKVNSLLVGMGLPLEVCEDLDLDALKKLIEFVSDKKK